MIRLPKGLPLYENIDASKLQLDTVTLKLANGCFTGYATFLFKGSTGYLLFDSGRLLCATFETGRDNRKNGYDALTALAEGMLLSDHAVLSVYRLSSELIQNIRGIMRGETRYLGQVLGLIDIKLLLEQIRNERLSCALRIHTAERASMIFYRDGAALGFFHDGGMNLENSPGESQRLTQNRDARLDMYVFASDTPARMDNLLELVNINSIWDGAVNRCKTAKNR